MKNLIIFPSADKKIYQRATLEIIRQLIICEGEGFNLKMSKLGDVDFSESFIIAYGKDGLDELVIKNDLYLNEVSLSSSEELEKSINTDAFYRNVLGRRRKKRRY